MACYMRHSSRAHRSASLPTAIISQRCYAKTQQEFIRQTHTRYILIEGFQPLRKTSPPVPHSFRSTLYLGQIDPFPSLSRIYWIFFLFKASSGSSHNLESLMLPDFRLTLLMSTSFLYLFENSFGPKDPRLLLSIKAGSINLCTFPGTSSAHLMEIVADDT